MNAEPVSPVRHCTRCGRALEVVVESRKRRDSKSGQRVVEKWLQCPRYPANGFVYLYRGNHTSLLWDAGNGTGPMEPLLIGREYR